MICPYIVSFYLSIVSFRQLNAFSQNYFPLWPNNPFKVGDFLPSLPVKACGGGSREKQKFESIHE